MNEDRRTSLLRTLQEGRIPSTLSCEEEDFVKDWLISQGHDIRGMF